jgi:hypothetical protein
MERDITRVAIEKSLPIVAGVLSGMKRQIPLGPRQVKMSRQELQRELKNARGRKILAVMDQIGMDETMSVLGESRGKNTR